MANEKEVKGAVTDIQSKQTTFDVLSVLSEEQRAKLAGRFNNSWTKPRNKDLLALQKQYGIDFFTAAFTQSVIEDADTLISNQKVSDVSERMFSLSKELHGTPAAIESALRDIQTNFDKLDENQQRSAGIKFRNSVLKGSTRQMANRVLELVTEKLGVIESEWVVTK